MCKPEIIKPVQSPSQRPSADEPRIKLAMKVTDSLNQALMNRMKQLNVAEADGDTGE